MAHEIDKTTGRPAMAYVGEVPWHRLGHELQRGADIDVWIRAAGLDWKALLSPVMYRTENSEFCLLDGRRVLYRSDTNAPLSIVSDKYNVVQPSEVLEFYRDLTQLGGFQLETAGALLGGAKVWALATRDMSWNIGDVDRIDGYLLLATSYDQSLATTAMLTTVRVVCQNTLNLALRGRIGGIKVVHKRAFDANMIKAELKLVDTAWQGFRLQIEALVQRTVKESELRPYFGRVMFFNDDVSNLE